MMKLDQAQNIVSIITRWQMFLQGVIEKEPDKLDSTLKLSELIEANSLVEAENKRKRSEQSKGNPQYKSVSIQITVADRLIAAVYVAMNYPANSEAICCINGVGVGCVKIKNPYK